VIKVDFLTANHHAVGYVTKGGGRFSDWLNFVDEPTVTLDDAILRSLEEFEAREVSVEFAVVVWCAIGAATPRETRAAVVARERAPKPIEYVEKIRHEVVVSLPPFALRGNVHLAKGVDLRRALASLTAAFVPFTEGRIVYEPNPRLQWEGEVILVNWSKAQLYWPSPDLDGR